VPDDPAQRGRWDPVLALPDAAIHAHVLPTGKVLLWGRRKDPNGGMHQKGCAPYVWDPATNTATPTPEPHRADGAPVNLFCSGHTFLADGRLLVAGGHITDGDGLDQACLYDAAADTWTALPVLRSGRWYPSAVTLADGRVLVISGSHQAGPDQPVEPVSEIWDGTSWTATRDFFGLPLYPRVHLARDRRVVMSGSNPETKLLDTAGAGTWSPVPGPGGSRANGDRQYGPAVTYAPGKVVYLGGGNDVDTGRPTADCERIDLDQPAPAWVPAASMAFRRRQHNATLLADGTVLVTGGTGGPGFNDLSPGSPVHAAELWDPVSDTWTTLAEEDVDRCYHATAVLLPDATVLSAGGGEFVVGTQPNPPAETHRDAQIFQPPYLFRGERPVIRTAPAALDLGHDFEVTTSGPAVAGVTLVRLSSTTHTFNMNQRFVRLGVTAAAGAALTVTAPAEAGDCPPGHYMLFALSAAGVPSTAQIVRVNAAQPPAAAQVRAEVLVRRAAPPSGTAVTVGLTAQCPYGLGPCWGGAYSALSHLDDVAHVEPVPNQTDQTAQVHLTHQGLPDLTRWPAQFAQRANASYSVRGVEVTVTGAVVDDGTRLHLDSPALPRPLPLRRLRSGTQLAWDLKRRRRRPLTADQRDAYARLIDFHREHKASSVSVTGPLHLVRGRPVLSVSAFGET
jgi:galactose oxidase